MKVLIACEFSGVVREAFRAQGHDAWSCDILPTEIPGPHIQDNVRNVLDFGWDLMVAHPPCTDLAVSGARWFADKGSYRQQQALDLVRALMNAPISHICIENPKGIISTHIRKPDQIIQPWMFGHGETKETHLWLKNLLPLVPTDYVSGREQRIWKMSPSENRGYERSRTYPGIARAMATQWGGKQPIQLELDTLLGKVG